MEDWSDYELPGVNRAPRVNNSFSILNASAPRTARRAQISAGETSASEQDSDAGYGSRSRRKVRYNSSADESDRKKGRRKSIRASNEADLVESEGEIGLSAYRTLFAVQHKTIFQKMIENVDTFKKWEPFLHISEEEETKLFERLGFLKDDTLGATQWANGSRFMRASDRQARLDLRRIHTEAFFFEFESLLVKYIQKNHDRQRFEKEKPRPLVLSFEDPFHRFIAVSVCAFYGLIARNIEVKNETATIISWTRFASALPTHLLSTYLTALKDNTANTNQFKQSTDLKLTGILDEYKKAKAARKAAIKEKKQAHDSSVAAASVDAHQEKEKAEEMHAEELPEGVKQSATTWSSIVQKSVKDKKKSQQQKKQVIQVKDEEEDDDDEKSPLSDMSAVTAAINQEASGSNSSSPRNKDEWVIVEHEQS